MPVDQTLWRKLMDGDAGAFHAVFDELSPPLLAFVRRYLGPHGPAEDVVQETLLQLWRNPRAFRSRAGNPEAIPVRHRPP